MKQILTLILTWCSRYVLENHKPIIIAVTGSVGKTSTKEAIAVVLRSKFDVRTAKKNFNTEIGVPLTILGIDQPKSKVGWLKIIFRAILIALRHDPHYPTHLVLEFGADRPGDIAHLCKLALPSVGVVTAISHVHVENYPSFEALVSEKTELVRALPVDGLAVLNADEELVEAMSSQTQAEIVRFGFSQEADVDGEGYRLEREPDVVSVFVAHDRRTEEQAEVRLIQTIGIHQAYDALAAIAVGARFGISVAEASEALKRYVSPPGRLKPLAGIKGSLLLDDTYNSAPSSTRAALEVLKQFEPAENGRRIVALGHMAELGAYSEQMHREIGWKVTESGVDLLVCAGEVAHDICRGAEEAGLEPQKIVKVKDAEEAGRYLDGEVRDGDVVLLKGSQSARMEKATRDLLAEPHRANDLLVRQEEEWR